MGLRAEQDLQSSIKTIFKGGIWIISGFFLATLLGFFNRVILTRHFPVEEFGIFALSLVIVNILVMMSSLGFEKGMPRYLSYLGGQGKIGEIKNLIIPAMAIVVVCSTFLSVGCFFFMKIFSYSLFRTKETIPTLKILLISVPLIAVLNFQISIFRGLENPRIKFFFGQIFPNLGKIFFYIVIIYLGFSIKGIAWGYVLSYWISMALLLIFFLKRFPIESAYRQNQGKGEDKGLFTEFVLFSLSLLVASALSMVMSWTDTLMVGIFRSPSDVALYSVAFSLSHFIPLVLQASLFIYMPVATRFFGTQRIDDLRFIYCMVTKWIFGLTLPIFLTIFLFSGDVLSACFGAKYNAASVAVRFLVIGTAFNAFLGPNIATLSALGKPRMLMTNSIIGIFFNIGLNLILIPRFGIEGASFASAVSLILINALASIQIFRLEQIHPFSREYILPGVLSIPTILLFYGLILKSLKVGALIHIPLFFLSSLLVHLFIVIVSKSYNKFEEDLFYSLLAKVNLQRNVGLHR